MYMHAQGYSYVEEFDDVTGEPETLLQRLKELQVTLPLNMVRLEYCLSLCSFFCLLLLLIHWRRSDITLLWPTGSFFFPL